MDDITFCRDDQCPYRMNCLRFMEEPESLASYFAESPFNDELEDCFKFIPWKEYDQDLREIKNDD